MVCTFFGHRDAPKTIKSSLKAVLSDLIENKNVNMFYVGNNGSFDSMVRDLLKEFKKTHNINYYVSKIIVFSFLGNGHLFNNQSATSIILTPSY